MHRAGSLIAFSFSLLMLASCGLKGPLRLPEEQQPATVPSEESATQPTKRRTLPPAPQSQKEGPAEQEAAPSPAPDPDRPANPEGSAPPPGR